MILGFSKYHGAGNDFIIIDERIFNLTLSEEIIRNLCCRHKGIGADGLMLINTHRDYDFIMKYFNSDGREGSMCGNGGRCISAYFFHNFQKKNHLVFNAVDGKHIAEIINHKGKITQVRLQLNDVLKVMIDNDAYILNTGSPHLVKFVDKLDDIDVVAEGRSLRYSEKYKTEGINVNFVELRDNELYARTYERGVEDETLSCGTGATAAAIAASYHYKKANFTVRTRGGKLMVTFTRENDEFKNVFLYGEAEFVFKGEIEI